MLVDIFYPKSLTNSFISSFSRIKTYIELIDILKLVSLFLALLLIDLQYLSAHWTSPLGLQPCEETLFVEDVLSNTGNLSYLRAVLEVQKTNAAFLITVGLEFVQYQFRNSLHHLPRHWSVLRVRYDPKSKVKQITACWEGDDVRDFRQRGIVA